ncbi:MAG: hypothetical protein GY785_01585 [Gammaproteobacteria bacterium]|nr:hypothetical protein [Gammaproteobacteria bacterium]
MIETLLRFVGFMLLMPFALVAMAAEDQAAEDLAKQSQNPVGDLISLPIEFHHYDGINGDASVNALFLKPVYPVKVGEFSLINRAIIPVLDLDAGSGGYDYEEVSTGSSNNAESGLGNIQYQGFFPQRSRRYHLGCRAGDRTANPQWKPGGRSLVGRYRHGCTYHAG